MNSPEARYNEKWEVFSYLPTRRRLSEAKFVGPWIKNDVQRVLLPTHHDIINGLNSPDRQISFKRRFSQIRKPTDSRVSLSVMAMDSISNTFFLDRARESIQTNNLRAFVLWFDSGFTLMAMSDKIITAEKAIRGDLDAFYNQVVEEAQNPLPQVAQYYLNLQKQSKACAEFLKQDPTGLKLLSETINAVQNPKEESDLIILDKNELMRLSPDVVLASSKFGKTLYETFYKLTEGLGVK